MTAIRIIDHGRGPQLSTSRVTVLDLFPYFQEGCSPDEIIRWIPTLTPDEIAVAHDYYLDHTQELLDRDRRAQERSGQNKNPAWVEEIAAQARAERQSLLERWKQVNANGEAR